MKNKWLRINHFPTLLVITILITMIVMMVQLVDFLATSRHRVAEHEDVVVLNKENMETRIHFGRSPMCGSTPCYTDPSFDDSQWKLIDPPSYDFKSDSDFANRKNSDFVYYRFHVTLPEKFLKTGREPFFTPMYIEADRYKVYINGSLVYYAPANTNASGMPIISVPFEYLDKENKVIITFEASLKPGYDGIHHLGKIFIGPIEVLNNLRVHQERISVSHPLVWTLTIGTLFFLFGLLFIFTKNKLGYSFVLLFSLGMLLRDFMISTISANLLSIPWRLFILGLARMVSNWAILAYLNFNFKLGLKRLHLNLFLLVLVTLVVALNTMLKFPSLGITYNTIFKIQAWSYWVTVFLGGVFMFRQRHRIPRAHLVFIALFLCIKVGLNLWFNRFYLHFTDLIFCLYIAFETVWAHGANEDKIDDQEKKIEEQARDAAIGQTAGHLAHDVRKPFSQVKILLDAFDLYKESPAALQQAKRDINSSLRQVETMISEIMDFSREQIGARSETSLIQLLNLTLKQVASAYEKEASKVSLDYSLKSHQMLNVNEDQVFRVFMNIINNAVEAILYMKEENRGVIRISSEDLKKEGREFIRLEISNDGPPIPEDFLANIFEPFQTSGKSKGTGLGLAGVKKIITLHGGEVKAENTAWGVKFTIDLPASLRPEYSRIELLKKNLQEFVEIDEASIQKLDNVLKSLSAINKKYGILILDDQKIYQEWVCSLINESNELSKILTVWLASNTQEAESILLNKKVHYAIIDIDLEEAKNGFDFLKHLKMTKPHIKALIHSNRVGSDVEARAKEEGAEGTLAKPLTFEDLSYFVHENLPVELKDVKNLKEELVYYCDDSELMRTYFTMTMNEIRPDAKIVTFENGEKLLNNFKEKPSDLIFTDLYMDESGGRMTGYELIEEIKKLNSEVPIILMSNLSIDQTRDRVKSLGGHDSLELPLDIKELSDVLDSL